MHDCRQTQDKLVDLMFNEADFATRDWLRAEVETCADCGAQFRSFTATLNAYDEASAALTPRASYWQQYHDALGSRLEQAAESVARAESAATENAPFWKHLLSTSIRVPAPLAVTVVLLFIASSIVSLTLLFTRPATADPIVLAAPTPAPEFSNAPAPHIELVEVPVVREKIVTQIVYVPRPATGGGGERSRRQLPRQSVAKVQAPQASSPGAVSPPASANLSGFKPAGEMNLRIIKENNAREQ